MIVSLVSQASVARRRALETYFPGLKSLRALMATSAPLVSISSLCLASLAPTWTMCSKKPRLSPLSRSSSAAPTSLTISRIATSVRRVIYALVAKVTASRNHVLQATCARKAPVIPFSARQAGTVKALVKAKSSLKCALRASIAPQVPLCLSLAVRIKSAPKNRPVHLQEVLHLRIVSLARTSTLIGAFHANLVTSVIKQHLRSTQSTS